MTWRNPLRPEPTNQQLATTNHMAACTLRAPCYNIRTRRQPIAPPLPLIHVKRQTIVPHEVMCIVGEQTFDSMR